MPVAGLRRKITVAIGITFVVLFTCYSFALFLYYRRTYPSGTVTEQRPQTAGLPTEQQLQAAERLLKDRKVEQALLSYRAMLARDPKHVPAQLGVAEAELRAGREADAAREFERVLKLDAKHRRALLELAHIYAHDKDTWPKAETRYRDYLKIDSGDAPAMLGLARVLAWQGKAAEAASLYGHSGVSRLMTPADTRNHAFALAKSGNHNQAIPLLTKLIGENRGDLELTVQLASIYAERKDWSNALPLYRSLIAARPNDARLQLTYGLGLLASRNYRDALGPLARARNAMMSSGEAGLAYARALKGSGQLKEASREFARVLPHYQRSGPVIREYADLLLERKDYGKAAEYYRAAYSLGMEDTRTLVGLGGSLTGDGKYKAALPYLEEAYRRSPTDRLAFELARVLRRLNRNQQAMFYLQKVQSAQGAALRR